MTNEEAIKRIKEHIGIHRLREQRAIYITESLDMAISALEKQIPKPLNDVSVFGGARCGECYTWIDKPDGMNYCPYCGQRIDWEDDETC